MRFVFQPAEEVMPGGAIDVVNWGALENVSAIYAVHAEPHVKVGEIGVRAVQLLLEIAEVAETAWFTRREVQWDTTPFDPDKGRRAVARVEERVRAGLPPGSVVSVTGLPMTDAMRRDWPSTARTTRPIIVPTFA